MKKFLTEKFCNTGNRTTKMIVFRIANADTHYRRRANPTKGFFERNYQELIII